MSRMEVAGGKLWVSCELVKSKAEMWLGEPKSYLIFTTFTMHGAKSLFYSNLSSAFSVLTFCAEQMQPRTACVAEGRCQLSTTSGCLAWLCSCLCWWLYNAPWRRFMIRLRQSWQECPVSLATTFPLILLHLLSNIQYFGNCSSHRAEGRGPWLKSTSLPPGPTAVASPCPRKGVRLPSELPLQGRWVQELV